MKITDKIYGEFEINDEVILKLIASEPLQRLKGIDQAAYSKGFYPKADYKNNTRYAHSVGVYLLLKKYNAPVEEQIAGLIHDVSHSAFSHAVDYALAEGSGKTQGHQDRVFNKFVRESEIPKILEKNSFDLEYILDDSNFPLKENELPDICADRIDYFLRNAVLYGDITSKDVQDILQHLKAINGKWIFDNYESARKFAEIAFKVNQDYFSSLTSAAMFMGVGNYIKHALQNSYISEKDLYENDEFVLKKIAKQHKKDKELLKLFNRIDRGVKYIDDPEDYEKVVYVKSRVIDPLYFEGKNIQRVSDKDPNWGKLIKENLKPKKYYLKFMD